jgi:RNA polymerase sigma-70 factor (ECF subfamily)
MEEGVRCSHYRAADRRTSSRFTRFEEECPTVSSHPHVFGNCAFAPRRDRSDASDAVEAAGDELLLGRLAGGDRDALATLYDRHGDAAFALAHEICGGAAQDIVDEAFLALWRQARAGRVGYARTRLLRITRKRALERQHQTGRRLPGGDRGPARGRPPSLIELSDPDARAALSAAPPAERQCLELAYLDGLSVAEIATLYRLPVAAVCDYLRRGGEGVRRRLSSTHAGAHPA